ncbi:DUF3795 domain-containing protein [Candidatus Cloacimonadota bacterium]
MIAYCGLKCHECEAFIATQENDNKKRKEIAELWSKEYNTDLSPEDINCTGCLSEGEGLFSNCNICEIRKCAVEKSIINCASCNDYICEKLNRFFSMVPEAKTNLEDLR